MLDSIYHMTLRLLCYLISAVKMLQFCHYVRNVVIDVIMFPENLSINFIAWRYITPTHNVM